MKDVFKKLKKLTGYKYVDIAKQFNISRQAVDQYSKNHSLVYQNNNKYMILTMVDRKIEEYEDRIRELKKFKEEVKYSENPNS